IGPQQAQALVDAVHESFAHSVAQTSLVGGIIMAGGAMVVLALLPRRKSTGKEDHAGRTTSDQQDIPAALNPRTPQGTSSR
ncbi:hypothetical protein ADL00_05655, partial [Streptomyces sp. AS58]